MEKRTILNCPVEFDKSDYFSLLSLSVGGAILRQTAMGELVIGDNGWNVDIKNGTITFGDKVFDAGIIGTENSVDNTWAWGSANKENGLPERASAPSRRARKLLGNVAEFGADCFALDEIHTGHNLSMICCATSESNVCYYRCPYDGGALFVQVSGLPEEVFAPVPAEALARKYVEIIQSFYCDHRLLAAGMLWLNGNEIETGDNFVAIKDAERMLTFTFEESGGLNRTTNIHLV
jgi:hypothetical protein